MKRTIIQQLIEWKDNPDRKPLIIKGARQIGKTWILKDFGKTHYKHLAYIKCDNEPVAKDLFVDYNILRILKVVEAITKVPIISGETLIVFDEIQELKGGLHSLKYFCEEAPEYHVAVAGSLLGLLLHPGESFPVGKVDMIDMHPMTFHEFLLFPKKQKIHTSLTFSLILSHLAKCVFKRKVHSSQFYRNWGMGWGGKKAIA